MGKINKKDAKKPQEIEERFQKMDQHEHVLEVPDTYVGTIKVDTAKMWVFDSTLNRMINKDIIYNPGIYKIFDEIVVNARDHSIRDKTCKTIKIWINKEEGEISVYNDGENGIPIAIHKEHKIYVPELIFGELLTSGNYRQTGKIVGGKNGYGAKLANIFSTEFKIEILDKLRKKKYNQRFYNNMYDKDDPIIKNLKGKNNSYLKLSFKPDFKRFEMDGFNDDMIDLFNKRVYDIAACTEDYVKVYLNDKLIEINTFQDYIKMFYDPNDSVTNKMVYEKVNDRWKIGAVYDPDCGYNQISYANGICTFDGGSHVDHVMLQIIKKLSDYIKNRNKKINVKNSYIRDNITIFVDSVIQDPSFTSQVKEKLKNKVADFGSKCDISDDFIKKLAKTGLEDEVVNFTKIKDLASLKKTDGKKTKSLKGIEKLDDARWAATKKSKYATLILTEGDSAKNFALAGLDIIGKDKFGVFPLKGKLLNVREATIKQLEENEEIINIKKIMGLKQNMKFTDGNLTQLRYGKILVLTDQDTDGSHIKGLLINFIHYFWPSLLKINGFIQSMATPIIKVWKVNDAKKNSLRNFYTLTEYQDWSKNVNKKLWKIKYYKGLGTHTSVEAKICFNDFDNKIIKYIWSNNVNDNDIINNDPDENVLDDDDNVSVVSNNSNKISDDNDDDAIYDKNESYKAIMLAFSKLKRNDRKVWLMNYNRDEIIENNEYRVSFRDFIHKDLKHFSNYDNIRSIPSICDGFKPSQRKILYGAILRKIFKDEVKVAQLAGFVSDRAAYHHGEASLQGAIISMAQTFVGTNNINLLVPNGDFGNRRLGGKNSASPRYIFTQLNELTPLLFRNEDDGIYNYIDDDGSKVEPEVYAPILPIILINGSTGIGTGFSTNIPSYNPKDIMKNIVRLIKGKTLNPMHPWYKNFSGTITQINDSTYHSVGIIKLIGENTINIKELPIGVWTEDYFRFLDSIKVDDVNKPKKGQIIESYTQNCGIDTIDIDITFIDGILMNLRTNNNLYTKLKLVKAINTSNMHLYDENSTIKKYNHVFDILTDYFNFRLNMYETRKTHYLKVLKNKLDIITFKIKFLRFVIGKKIIIMKSNNQAVSKKDIIDTVVRLNFPKLSPNAYANEDDKKYEYITSLSIFSLTEEELAKLEDEKDIKEAEYLKYKNTPAHDIWLAELKEFELMYDKWFIAQSISNPNIKKKKGKSSKHSKKS